tara:strand:+ start:96 stop:251 length:156 start_codon:yes stop_codon:yes gene_type:complete
MLDATFKAGPKTARMLLKNAFFFKVKTPILRIIFLFKTKKTPKHKKISALS